MSENTTTGGLVEELRALHVRVETPMFGGVEHSCRGCGQDWPCDTTSLLDAHASRTAEARTVDAPGLLLSDGYAAYGTDWDAAQRLVVRGSNNEGQTIVLEQVYDGEDPTERRRVWSVSGMSKPFNHDVHLARERVTTTYERVAPEAVSADD